MLRTVYMPSNSISVSIPDRHIGTELEILVFPKKKMFDIDTSFGGWADMDKTSEEICSEIRASRNFRNNDIVL